VNSAVFIGGGRITSALIAGLRKAKHKGAITVHDRNPEKLRALKRDFGVAIEPDLCAAVARADMLILAVRPNSIAETLDSIACFARTSNPLVVSLAAGVPLKNLRPHVKPWLRWSRALPSPLCRIRRGLTAVAFDQKLSRHDREHVRKFFGQVGRVLEMPESRLDVFNAAYSPLTAIMRWRSMPKARRRADWTRKPPSPPHLTPWLTRSSTGGKADRIFAACCKNPLRPAELLLQHCKPWMRQATKKPSPKALPPASVRRN
jgi:hypothetical protein